MDEIDLLPREMMALSLSDREVVFPFKEAIEAISIFERNDFGLLDWEGWAKHPNGRIGHYSQREQISLSQKASEKWEDFCCRSAQACRETIQRCHEFDVLNPDENGRLLYYCLTAVSLAEYQNLSSEAKINFPNRHG